MFAFHDDKCDAHKKEDELCISAEHLIGPVYAAEEAAPVPGQRGDAGAWKFNRQTITRQALSLLISIL